MQCSFPIGVRLPRRNRQRPAWLRPQQIAESIAEEVARVGIEDEKDGAGEVQQGMMWGNMQGVCSAGLAQ